MRDPVGIFLPAALIGALALIILIGALGWPR